MNFKHLRRFTYIIMSVRQELDSTEDVATVHNFNAVMETQFIRMKQFATEREMNELLDRNAIFDNVEEDAERVMMRDMRFLNQEKDLRLQNELFEFNTDLHGWT